MGFLDVTTGSTIMTKSCLTSNHVNFFINFHFTSKNYLSEVELKFKCVDIWKAQVLTIIQPVMSTSIAKPQPKQLKDENSIFLQVGMNFVCIWSWQAPELHFFFWAPSSRVSIIKPKAESGENKSEAILNTFRVVDF